MKLKLNFLLILTVAVGLVSCENDPFGIVGNGEVVEEVRQIDDFNKLVVNGPFKVDVVVSDSDELVISGESNILPHINTEVKNGYLVIDPSYEQTLYINKPLIVTIPATSLDEVELNGSGKVVVPAFEEEEFHVHLRGSGTIDAGVNASDLTVILAGSGEIKLNGAAENGDVYLEGSGELKAFDTEIENCKIEIYGSADADVYVTNDLEVDINGSGDVIYMGDPTLDTNLEGSGQVRKKE